jgi:hypothetical protein
LLRRRDLRDLRDLLRRRDLRDFFAHEGL